jgi:hypothetical protein
MRLRDWVFYGFAGGFFGIRALNHNETLSAINLVGFFVVVVAIDILTAIGELKINE